ncbi:MAG: Crp/Fnr family transcriptional regulator [Bacteroidetes bacterium]|nr:Crp/Fnr family transcriptional regulator [Bacteroidota bacterium]
MDDAIITFISSYIDLTPDEKSVIQAQNIIKTYPKGTVLLAHGDLAQDCFFILKGCVRRYYIVDGDERTTEFFTENQGITPVSYLTKQPSDYYLSCLEPCVIALGSDERNQLLLEKVPKLARLIAQMSTELLVKSQITSDNFKNMNPENRYLHLLETRPDLVARIPLQHIATFLGMTPVSLSRLRKRITLKR